MAIKFGDTLENQNSDYPIIDLSGGHAAGISYLTTFNNTDLANIPVNKRKDGMLVVDKTSGNVYVWKGGDEPANGSGFNDIEDSNWVKLGETPLETSDLNVQLPDGNTFGRFSNGDTITVLANGSNALQIIKDAITGYIDPTGSITSSATSFNFSVSERLNESHTLTFTVKNENQNGVTGTAANSGFAIRNIYIQRRKGSDAFATLATLSSGHTTYGTFDDLNTAGTPTSVSFSYQDNDVDIPASEDSDGNYDYRIRVEANDSSGTAQTIVTVATANNQVSIANYAAPTSTDSITRNSSYTAPTGFKAAYGNTSVTFAGTGNNSSDANLVVGDNNLGASFSISRNSPLVDMTSYTVQRIVGGSVTNISNSTPGVTITGTASAASFSVTIVDNQAASVRTSVKYRVKVVDAHQTTNLDSPTFTYLHLSYLGFATEDNLPVQAAQDAGVVEAAGGDNTTLTEAIIEGLDVRKLATPIGNAHLFTGSSNYEIALNAGTNEFLYICYPDASDNLTIFKAVGASNTLDSDLASGEANSGTFYSEAFTNNTINVTNVAGLTEAYKIYRSVSPTAFNGSTDYAIY